MSAMPGFIDSHKHVNTGPQEKGQMRLLLEAGYTTIPSERAAPDVKAVAGT